MAGFGASCVQTAAESRAETGGAGAAKQRRRKKKEGKKPNWTASGRGEGGDRRSFIFVTLDSLASGGFKGKSPSFLLHCDISISKV